MQFKNLHGVSSIYSMLITDTEQLLYTSNSVVSYIVGAGTITTTTIPSIDILKIYIKNEPSVKKSIVKLTNLQSIRSDKEEMKKLY